MSVVREIAVITVVGKKNRSLYDYHSFDIADTEYDNSCPITHHC